MGSCPKEKDEEELKDQADKIKTGKLTTQRMGSELMQTKNLEVINWVYAVAQEANKAACTGQGKQYTVGKSLHWMDQRWKALGLPTDAGV
jgi:hypothetical protein